MYGTGNVQGAEMSRARVAALAECSPSMCNTVSYNTHPENHSQGRSSRAWLCLRQAKFKYRLLGRACGSGEHLPRMFEALDSIPSICPTRWSTAHLSSTKDLEVGGSEVQGPCWRDDSG